MTVNQISIFLENKYGTLSEILMLLAEANIRIIVNDPQRAYALLKEHNVSANLSDVLAIVTHSEAAGFARTLQAFTKAGLTIEYMYCFSAGEKSILIIRTNNREAAREVIRRQNMDYLCENDLLKFN